MSFSDRFTLIAMPRATVGEMLSEWRHRRSQSQLDLSVEVGVSARHLSFVETGRSRPSPELVLAIAEELRVPLRERNNMLLAAGYAPRYSQTDLDDESMLRIRSSLQMMLDRHNPYPGVVIDRQWNVMLANETARMLTQGLPTHVLEPRLNVFRICLHPDGLASRTINFDEWARYLLGQIRRSIQLTGDSGLEAIHEEVSGYPNLSDLATTSRDGHRPRAAAADPIQNRHRPGGSLHVHHSHHIRDPSGRDIGGADGRALLPRRRHHRTSTHPAAR